MKSAGTSREKKEKHVADARRGGSAVCLISRRGKVGDGDRTSKLMVKSSWGRSQLN